MESDRKLNYANKYEIGSLPFDVIELKESFNTTKIFSGFVKLVNSQRNYNQVGKLNVVPFITSHNSPIVEHRGLLIKLQE
jgi:hypothetical protein